MNYKNAKKILPDILVKELQKYIQAEYLYVPAYEEHHKSWGEVSGYRKELERRNQTISKSYHMGMSIEELAQTYHLSIYAIRKIIYQKKR